MPKGYADASFFLWLSHNGSGLLVWLWLLLLPLPSPLQMPLPLQLPLPLPLLSPRRPLGFTIVPSLGFLMANIANTIATTMICNEHDCATTMSMHYHYHDQHCKRKLDNCALLLPRLSQLPLSQP